MFYAKEKHVRKRLVRAIADRCNTIVMDPKRGFLESLQQLAAGLRDGKCLMIFPEGTRTGDGTLGPFKDSYAILASELTVPVVPVVINGAHAVLPRGKRIPKLHLPITITYLPPMRPMHGELAVDFNARVRGEIQAALAVRP
jgi:long-chain acyl-CoA synthetase